jgi:hypothetical protein
MYIHKTMGIRLLEMSFPSEEFEEEDPITHRCTSFGEAAIMIANDPNVFGKTDFFSSVSIMVLLRTPPSGLHTMMTTKSMKILSNSVLILGELMMGPQTL